MSEPVEMTGLEIAIIGMAGRFPGANDVDALWTNLLDGVESIQTFTPEQLGAAGVSPELLADPAYVRAGGVLEGVDRFDAGFFGYSPREAALIDPQQRVFLETAWAAMEQAGYAPGAIDAVVGVYAGMGPTDYLVRQVLGGAAGTQRFDHQAVVANDKDFLASRVAYKLNLQGPALVVQTACSTSLVAVHVACQALLAGDCDVALAGGVTIRVPHGTGYVYQEDGIASPDGHCRAFSAAAQGCVPGNGSAVVVLKPLARALADRDCIHAVIKGTAINNDGSHKVGYTAPGVEGQRQVIRAALAVAGVSADTIGYLEAHGTGTLIGDPIEVEAASRAFREDTTRRGYCAIGSVKTNLGHLDAAAGVTGLIKAALAVKNGIVPPSLHGAPANPRIDFEASPFFVNTSRREWRPPHPRRAGVSAFGIGGTNAHAVVEQPPAVDEAVASSGPELLVLSAKTPDALVAASAALAVRLGATSAPRLDDVAFSLRQGRAAFPHRRAVVARTGADAAAQFAAAAGVAASQPHREASQTELGPRVVFMFPGQGSQYAGMGAGLPALFTVARAELDRCIGLAQAAGVDLRALLEAPRGNAAADARLRDTRLAQPAIFSLSYALARQLIEWGVQPAAMIGHSIGEYVAACLAGVMTLEDALAIVIERGRLTSALPAGAMASVALDADELRRVLPPGVSLAAVNAPGRGVVSGDEGAVAPFMATLAARGVDIRPLRTSHAFHSEMMEPAVSPLVARVSAARLRAPQARYVSNVTGTWITADDAVDPGYYGRHLRGTVRFSDGLAEILAAPGTLLVEVGPGTTLTTLARRHASAREVVAVPTTPHPDEPGTAGEATLRAVGALWSARVAVSWQRFDRESTARRVPLPSYPFARARHWIDRIPEASVAGRQADVAQWLSIPSWERVAPAAIASAEGADEARSVRLRDAGLWLVLTDARGVGADLARQLRLAGAEVITVARGARYDERGDSCTIDPAEAAHYDRLAGLLAARRPSRLQIVHGWTIDADGEIRRGAEGLDDVYARGFLSLLSIARTLGDQPWLSSCRLTVLASHLHEVTGGEALWPEKATVLGPCRTIPLEYPQFECLSIDVDPGDADAHDRARIVKLVIDTLLDTPGETLAIRGRHRWRQVMRPRPLGPVETLPGFKPGGAYLIAGGLKGVGLALAEHLARTLRARLMLVGRTPLPPRSAAADAEGDAGHTWARDLLLAAARDEGAAFTSPDAQPVDPGPEWAAKVDRLCAAYAWRFFARAGVDAGRASTGDRAALRERCGVQPRFTRYVDALVRMLEEDGLVDGASAPDAEALAAATRAGHPSMAPLLDVLRTCADAMNDSLTGAAPALEPLFGDAHYEAFQRAVQTVRAHSFVPACERIVGDIVSKLPRDTGRRLRILEVGGGEGLLTQVLLPLLEGRNVDYHFTDIGRAFVAGTRRRAEEAGQRFVRADVLDISRSPGEQGFEAGAYDVVLAFNVLHATPDVVASLRHARQLLAPGGLLLLQESTRPARWIDLIWGLTDGWWSFEDTTRRTTSPLLGLEAWERALAEAGFDRPTAYPRAAADRARTDTGVIAGIQPGSDAGAADGSVAATLRALRRIEQAGGEVEVVTADVADADAMRAAVARAEERWGRLDGVVHGALVLNDGTIRGKTLDAAKVVFHPKIDGTLALQRALDGRPLDLFVLFSSLVSTISGPGQVDYCAASAFQDAFALAEQGRLARRVVAIDWAGWRDVGKAYRSAIERGASADAAVPNGMTVAEGLDALGRALATGAPQVIVSPERLEHIYGRRREGGAETLRKTDSAMPVAAEEPAAAVNEVERVIAAIWSEVLGVARVGAQDNFFDLGGDSVISLQFVAQAKKAGLKLTSKQVFEHQTVEALAAVAQPIGKDGAPKDGVRA
ncbi:MAG TPA: SDR family NAD(P)-dependent oxidoreductase [Vicinamibacterales bacterium]|jgi:acyl transferase domain-containing protein/SAM-dependent methyltransferase/aryl carrier-like protein|nr:SDR family NAD(P)-dependent oxidoreductase [Vicinamibacterales bacterium]